MSKYEGTLTIDLTDGVTTMKKGEFVACSTFEALDRNGFPSGKLSYMYKANDGRILRSNKYHLKENRDNAWED